MRWRDYCGGNAVPAYAPGNRAGKGKIIILFGYGAGVLRFHYGSRGANWYRSLIQQPENSFGI